MKRSLDTVLHELASATAQCNLLLAERDAHPAHVAAEAQRRRANLVAMLPTHLARKLVPPVAAAASEEGGDGPLEWLAIDEVPSVDEDGEPFLEWRFAAHFAGRLGRVAFVADRARAARYERLAFEPVHFERPARRLWQRALDMNENDTGAALAAFCFACCEHLDDYSADPADAFADTKGKHEAGIASLSASQ